MNLPSPFVQNISRTFPNGREWLAQLPQKLADCQARWHLTLGPAFEPLSYNYVAPATLADGRQIVFKLGVSPDELSCEIGALRLYNGRASCQLIDADAAVGVLLLEKIEPGHMLTAVSDEETAIQIAADLMRQLWQPAPTHHSFPTLADWAAGLQKLRPAFGGQTGPFPPRLVEMAQTLHAELLASTAVPYLLHGDLHHYNILAAQRRPWLAIDPKGVVGDPAYEPVAFICNAIPDHCSPPQLKQMLNRRLDIFAERLGLDRSRLLAWCMATQLLSAWEDYDEASDGWRNWLRMAETFAELIV